MILRADWLIYDCRRELAKLYSCAQTLRKSQRQVALESLDQLKTKIDDLEMLTNEYAGPKAGPMFLSTVRPPY